MGSLLLIGLGGLGAAAASALAAGGVKRLGLADPDRTEISNLHRQVLYRGADVGRMKVESARERLLERSPGLEVEIFPRALQRPEEIAEAAAGYAAVVDCSDNFATRFAANDAAFLCGKPLVHGAATGFRGQLMTIVPGESACLRCLFGGPPEEEGATCREAGVLGTLPAQVGVLMALEALKLLNGEGGTLTDRMLTIDLARGVRREVPLRRNSHCSACFPSGAAE